MVTLVFEIFRVIRFILSIILFIVGGFFGIYMILIMVVTLLYNYDDTFAPICLWGCVAVISILFGGIMYPTIHNEAENCDKFDEVK